MLAVKQCVVLFLYCPKIVNRCCFNEATLNNQLIWDMPLVTAGFIGVTPNYGSPGQQYLLCQPSDREIKRNKKSKRCMRLFLFPTNHVSLSWMPLFLERVYLYFGPVSWVLKPIFIITLMATEVELLEFAAKKLVFGAKSVEPWASIGEWNCLHKAKYRKDVFTDT